MRAVIRPGGISRRNENTPLSENAQRSPHGMRVAHTVPSKSVAHRLLVCTALAKGRSGIENLAHSADIDATAAAIRLLGAGVEWSGSGAEVQGAPGDYRPGEPVDCGESGSTLRFLIPLFSLVGEPVVFTGAKRLFERPLGPYEDIFRERGLVFERSASSLLIEGPLTPGEYRLPGNISSQFISGLLFALPLLSADSTIVIEPPFESWGYVTLTRQAQAHFSITSAWSGPLTLLVPGDQHYQPATVAVEGDWSQGVAYLVLAAALGGFAIEGLDPETAQGDRVALDVIRACGASTTFKEGLLHITPPADGLISPGEVDLSGCPDLGPVLFSLAALCKGTTRFVNAGRLRIKESDRIAAMEAELQKMGVAVSCTEDTVTVEGTRPLTAGATVSSHNDHRVAMATAVLALGGGVPLTIEGADAVDKSWPTFFDNLRDLGADIELS